ncbi:hypothetical protein SK128_008463, partial [Halocaridina rubra]
SATRLVVYSFITKNDWCTIGGMLQLPQFLFPTAYICEERQTRSISGFRKRDFSGVSLNRIT